MKVCEAGEELKKNVVLCLFVCFPGFVVLFFIGFALGFFFPTYVFQHESCSCRRHLGARSGNLLPLTAYPSRDLDCDFSELKFDTGEIILGIDIQ